MDYIDIAPTAYDTGDFIVSGGIPGTDYSYDSSKLTIHRAGTYEIGMKDGVETIEGCIEVNAKNADDEVILVLYGVNIEVADENASSALTITRGDVTLDLYKASSLTGSPSGVNSYNAPVAPSGKAGITGDFTLGLGTLRVLGGMGGNNSMGGTGGTGGAGIDGTVYITNGELHVDGGQGGAGSSESFAGDSGFTHGKGGDGGSGVTGEVHFTGGSFTASGGSGNEGSGGSGSTGKAVEGVITVSDGFAIRAGSSTIESGRSTDASSVIIEPAPAPETYTLTVALNGGSGDTTGGDYAEGANIPINAGTKANCRFNGWTSSNGGTFDSADSASTTFTMPGSDVTVTANWKAVDGGDSTDYYTLSFVSNGGSAVADFTRAEGRVIDLTLAHFQPERAGYSFTGWYADEALTQHIDSICLTQDTRVFAGWEQNAWETPFADVKPADWFYSDVRYVYENDLMTGTSEALFSPAAPMTRAMLITALWRMAGEPTINYIRAPESAFTDVAGNEWFAKAVEWAALEGIVEGSGGSFRPNDFVTREQLVTILHRYAMWKELDVSIGEDTNILSYNDAFDIARWAVPSFQWACGAGVVQGDGGGNLRNL